MSYGPNRPDLFRRAGDIADKIFQKSFLLRADEVIE
jgi:hypothetical protein